MGWGYAFLMTFPEVGLCEGDGQVCSMHLKLTLGNCHHLAVQSQKQFEFD